MPRCAIRFQLDRACSRGDSAPAARRPPSPRIIPARSTFPHRCRGFRRGVTNSAKRTAPGGAPRPPPHRRVVLAAAPCRPSMPSSVMAGTGAQAPPRRGRRQRVARTGATDSSSAPHGYLRPPGSAPAALSASLGPQTGVYSLSAPPGVLRAQRRRSPPCRRSRRTGRPSRRGRAARRSRGSVRRGRRPQPRR